eukprot:13756580-Heterocapsa_arctica.AAC.1
MEPWQVPCGTCASTEGKLNRRCGVDPHANCSAPYPQQDEANDSICWGRRQAFGRTLRCRRRG